MKKLILISVLLASSQMVIGANWVPSQASSITYKEITHIDFDSVQGYHFNSYDKTNYYVTAWTKSNYPNLQILSNGKKYKESKSFNYVDCIHNKKISGEEYYYSASGNLIDSVKIYINTSSSDTWYRTVPDSVGEQIAKEICSIYQFKQFKK